MSEVYSVPEVEPLPDRLQQKLMNLAERSDKIGPRTEFEALAVFADGWNVLTRKGLSPEVVKAISPVAETSAKAARAAGGVVDVSLKPLGLLAIPVGGITSIIGIGMRDPQVARGGAALAIGGAIALGLTNPVRRTEIAVFRGVRDFHRGTEKVLDAVIDGTKKTTAEAGKVSSAIVDRILGKAKKSDIPAAA